MSARIIPLVLGLLLSGCAADGPAVLVLDIDADLEIGREVNELRVQLRADGEPLEDTVYPLGEGDRADWPQILPIVEGALHPSMLTIRLELAWNVPGGRVVLGATEMQARFPGRRTQHASVYVRRACEDFDSDGYGVGYGCDEPDCDDFDPATPLVRDCEFDYGTCAQERDCEGVHLACQQRHGICVCRLPCVVDAECAGLRCADGCCQI